MSRDVSIRLSAGIADRVSSATPLEIGLAVGATVASFALSIVAAAFVAVRLPEDYFVTVERPLPLEGRALPLRIAARVAMNLLGLLLIVAGIVMSFPGVPGQGVLTILLGVMLVDIPGKRRVERALIRRPVVHRAIDKLRRRWNRPPIQIPE
jgi:hypothetical protein